jgi:CHASE2 domain-containing sensor protein
VKRYGLLPATLASMVFGAWFAFAAGWFTPPAPTPAPSGGASLSAAWNYYHGHARHWRHCLLQH